MTRSYRPAIKPTIYFIGVTTNKSSIMKIFPLWAEYLGLRDTEIKGIDFPPLADPAAYRQAVEFIKNDPLSECNGPARTIRAKSSRWTGLRSSSAITPSPRAPTAGIGTRKNLHRKPSLQRTLYR